MFANWCILKGIPPLPVAPATVAAFIADCTPLGVEKVWEAVRGISIAHLSQGLADPTAGGQAALAMNALSRIDPPRSWPKDEKARFFALPYDLQVYMHKREGQRDKAVKQAQDAAATARKEQTDGTQPNTTDRGTDQAIAGRA